MQSHMKHNVHLSTCFLLTPAWAVFHYSWCQEALCKAEWVLYRQCLFVLYVWNCVLHCWQCVHDLLACSSTEPKFYPDRQQFKLGKEKSKSVAMVQIDSLHTSLLPHPPSLPVDGFPVVTHTFHLTIPSLSISSPFLPLILQKQRVWKIMWLWNLWRSRTVEPFTSRTLASCMKLHTSTKSPWDVW